MVANNPYLIPKVEEVRYLNNEVPSYEEFMKSYKVDERVKNSYESEINAYSELGKGYGPTRILPLLPDKIEHSFRLMIKCHDWSGNNGDCVRVYSIDQAIEQVNRLEDGSWNSSFWISRDILRKCAELVWEAVNEGYERPVDGVIEVQGRSWYGGVKWSYKY